MHKSGFTVLANSSRKSVSLAFDSIAYGEVRKYRKQRDHENPYRTFSG